jgi:CRISPR-associated endonuclease/helicase Cas3
MHTPKKYFEPWLEIVTGHHGKPPNKNLRYQRFFTEEDELAALEFIQVLAQLLLTEFDFQLLANKDLIKRLKSVSWQLAGLSVLADWLGSNQEYFAFHSQPQELMTYWHNIALPNAKRAITALPVPSQINEFKSIKDLFVFIEHSTPLQNYAANVTLANQAQLFILEDVTGAGKPKLH